MGEIINHKLLGVISFVPGLYRVVQNSDFDTPDINTPYLKNFQHVTVHLDLEKSLNKEHDNK